MFLEKIGYGAFGDVYKAKDENTGKHIINNWRKNCCNKKNIFRKIISNWSINYKVYKNIKILREIMALSSLNG